MKRQYIIAIVIAAAVLFLAGAGILAYGLSQGGAIPGVAEPTPTPPAVVFPAEIPDVEITPPPSLAEIADEIRTD